jgi:hypothetical protein
LFAVFVRSVCDGCTRTVGSSAATDGGGGGGGPSNDGGGGGGGGSGDDDDGDAAARSDRKASGEPCQGAVSVGWASLVVSPASCTHRRSTEESSPRPNSTVRRQSSSAHTWWSGGFQDVSELRSWCCRHGVLQRCWLTV